MANDSVFSRDFQASVKTVFIGDKKYILLKKVEKAKRFDKDIDPSEKYRDNFLYYALFDAKNFDEKNIKNSSMFAYVRIALYEEIYKLYESDKLDGINIHSGKLCGKNKKENKQFFAVLVGEIIEDFENMNKPYPEIGAYYGVASQASVLFGDFGNPAYNGNDFDNIVSAFCIKRPFQSIKNPAGKHNTIDKLKIGAVVYKTQNERE